MSEPPKRKFLDASHPMFRPLWVRVLVVALCIGWAVFEFTGGSAFWGVLFLALGLYAGWVFFVEDRRGGGSGGQT
jgi:hypothetical protein